MAWVYVLRGSTGRHYFGSTTDLSRRLAEHRRGHTYSTRRLGNTWILVHAVELPTLAEARQWELRLKDLKRPAYALELLRSIP